MVVLQKLEEAEITEQDSLLLTMNLLRIAIFNISYIRGLFPEKYFDDKSVPALDLKIKKLMPMDAESRRLINVMEKGVYDALRRKYLETLMFCICETVDGPMIEEYSFSFSYSDSDSQDVMMNINLTGDKKNGETFNSTADTTRSQVRISVCKMVRTLVQLMETLAKMPDERTIVLKLLYYDDVMPPDYEPPFFRGCREEEAQYVWTKNPLRMEIGNVNSKHIVLKLKAKSVLDPCDNGNDEMQDDRKSIGPDSVHDDQPSDSDSEGFVMTGELQEMVDKMAPCVAITEKPQSRLGGCVGVFFQLFDWNRRFAKKNLYSRKSLSGKQVSKRFGGNEKMLKSMLNLIDDENRGSFSSRGEAVELKKHQMRSPSLVARLMGFLCKRRLACDSSHRWGSGFINPRTSFTERLPLDGKGKRELDYVLDASFSSENCFPISFDDISGTKLARIGMNEFMGIRIDEVVGSEMDKWLDLETHLIGLRSEIADEIFSFLVGELIPPK